MSPASERTPNAPDILLVEDNPYDAELTLLALRKEGLADQLIWLKDGAETLEFLFGESGVATLGNVNPKVILLDLKLPKVDGQEVLRRIKGDPRTRTIPVVVLTSSREDSDVVGSYEAGANSYIVKPVDVDKFFEAVKRLGLFWLAVNEPPERRLPAPESRL